MIRPAILIDVDGVLNPDIKHHVSFCKCHPGWIRRRGWSAGIRYKLSLNPHHGKQLRDLATDTDADMFWMTTWEDDANYEIAPYVGLATLPVIRCPHRPAHSCAGYGEWKANQAAVWARQAKRPFVWFDDEPDAPAALADMIDIPHLVITVDERIGLTDEHISQARQWLRDLLAEVPAN